MKKTLISVFVLTLFIAPPSLVQAEEDAHNEAGHDHAAGGDNHREGTGEEDEYEGGHAEEREHEEEEGHGHEEESDGGHEEAATASINAKQKELAGIEVATLESKRVDYEIYAPGELLTNGYTSYHVSPRVASVVLRRHVELGEHVTKGQQLVTLFSETVAQAQADYRKAFPEWERISGLGRSVVGDQRFNTAKANIEAARATLLAYGLNDDDIGALKASGVGSLGEYTLRARVDGAVLTDEFEQGQRVEAGQPLVTLANESELWVEAHLPANSDIVLKQGAEAEVRVAGRVAVATVSQEAHTIDAVTRTRIVRLELDNPEDRFHPGMFADVYFLFKTTEPVLAVPESALMRGADGDWTVYVEEAEAEYEPVEVELGRSIGGLREIFGLTAGQRIVSRGAFFVASEIAKGGFDPHNH
ncbi:putative Co/Zn/Cd efflux system membrane fusion protein [Marinobacter salarius]|uniref:efflux RND transporter periplasmic adaptor subunit n=1 Tax=Marinobacter salarius TaxID=1420917 RepID=UPI00125B5DF3|nr:efflux RND transporter periplasmic adaptor subunit [Marinobacter salarius]VVT32692.1 Cobalt-zinc-cadmium resistance protein CzcB [Marinobacter salarius]VXA94331.1 putative Co/Zn/Cd efflux system membrane fusion protein [Marinobacter salarius]